MNPLHFHLRILELAVDSNMAPGGGPTHNLASLHADPLVQLSELALQLRDLHHPRLNGPDLFQLGM